MPFLNPVLTGHLFGLFIVNSRNHQRLLIKGLFTADSRVSGLECGAVKRIQ